MLLLGEIGPVEAEKFDFEDSLFFQKMAKNGIFPELWRALAAKRIGLETYNLISGGFMCPTTIPENLSEIGEVLVGTSVQKNDFFPIC